MLSGEFLKVIFSKSVLCIYVLHILSLSAIPWSRISPDGWYNRKKFQFRSCIFYGRSVINGLRKGDPNIRVRIAEPYSKTTKEGREVWVLLIKDKRRKVLSGEFRLNIFYCIQTKGSDISYYNIRCSRLNYSPLLNYNIASPTLPLPPLDLTPIVKPSVSLLW